MAEIADVEWFEEYTITVKVLTCFFIDSYGNLAECSTESERGLLRITRKVCHMDKLACRAIRVTKTREFASINISSAESHKLACRAVSPAFSCVANLSVGNGKPFG
jgi:hypothetical protein